MNYFRNHDYFLSLLREDSFIKFSHQGLTVELTGIEINIQPSFTHLSFQDNSTIIVRSRYATLLTNSRFDRNVTLSEGAAEISHRSKGLITASAHDQLTIKTIDGRLSISQSRLTVVDNNGKSHVFTPVEYYVGSGPNFTYRIDFDGDYHLHLKYRPSNLRHYIKKIEYQWTCFRSDPWFEGINIVTTDKTIIKIRDGGSCGTVTRNDKTVAISKDLINPLRHANTESAIKKSIDKVLTAIDY
jgi:hypothetical protein